MANILARTPYASLSVAGMVIVDSPYHMPWSQLIKSSRELDIGDLPPLVRKSFDNCDEMLDTWELPRWSSTAAFATVPLRCHVRGKSYVLEQSEVVHCPEFGPGKVLKMKAHCSDPSALNRSFSHNFSSPSSSSSSDSGLANSGERESMAPIGPPPAVLIRCLQNTPTKGPDDDTDLHHLDEFRNQTLLGWEGNYPPFIKASFDIDSHHFDVFDMKKVSGYASDVWGTTTDKDFAHPGQRCHTEDQRCPQSAGHAEASSGLVCIAGILVFLVCSVMELFL
jgi:hypothetical protein